MSCPSSTTDLPVIRGRSRKGKKGITGFPHNDFFNATTLDVIIDGHVIYTAFTSENITVEDNALIVGYSGLYQISGALNLNPINTTVHTLQINEVTEAGTAALLNVQGIQITPALENRQFTFTLLKYLNRDEGISLLLTGTPLGIPVQSLTGTFSITLVA